MTVKKLAFAAAAAGAILLSAVAAYADTTATTVVTQNGTSGDVRVTTHSSVSRGGSVMGLSGNVSNGALVGTVAGGSRHSDVTASTVVTQTGNSGDVHVSTHGSVSRGGSVGAQSGDVTNAAGVFTGAFTQSH